MNIISRMKYRIRHSFVLLVSLAGLFFMSSCSNNDCPLSNIVRCYYRFYHSGTGQPASCPDTVSVCIHDSILLNKIVNGNSFNLPMSYSEEEDTIHILFENSAVVLSCLIAISLIMNLWNVEHPSFIRYQV